jgi:hypothetical protein
LPLRIQHIEYHLRGKLLERSTLVADFPDRVYNNWWHDGMNNLPDGFSDGPLSSRTLLE